LPITGPYYYTKTIGCLDQGTYNFMIYMNFYQWDLNQGSWIYIGMEVSSGNFNVRETAIDNYYTEFPKKFILKQNYPNPFNPTTSIIYSLPTQSRVDIKIFDLLGKEVVTLVNDNQEAKYYKVIWDAKDRLGNSVPSGMYLYRIVAKSGNKTFVKTRKLLLMR